MKTFLLALVAASGLMAQSATHQVFAGLIDTNTLPQHTTSFGVGIQSGSNLNGMTEYCNSVSPTSFLCAQSKFSGSTTSNTLVYKQVVFAQRGLVAAINGNGGVATGADGGTGGAWAVGGSAYYNVGRLSILKKHPGLFVGLSADWDKRDVYTFVSATGTVQGLRTSLKPFVTKGTYEFTIGTAWN